MYAKLFLKGYAYIFIQTELAKMYANPLRKENAYIFAKEMSDNAQNAGKAYNRDRGLPDSAKIPHMTHFDPFKLPSRVRQCDSDECPDWVREVDSWT